MKVILTAEVNGKGHEGDVVDVARGYAVNYLMPRKMAIEATTGNIKQLDARMSNIRKRNDARLSDAESVAASIDGKAVTITAKTGADGKLFGSVTTLMIEEAVEAQLGADVDHKRMGLHRPIKTAGRHEIVVGVYGDVKATLTVNVVAEGAVAGESAPVEAVVVEPAVAEEAEVEETEADEAAADEAEETPEDVPGDQDAAEADTE